MRSTSTERLRACDAMRSLSRSCLDVTDLSSTCAVQVHNFTVGDVALAWALRAAGSASERACIRDAVAKEVDAQLKERIRALIEQLRRTGGLP